MHWSNPRQASAARPKLRTCRKGGMMQYDVIIRNGTVIDGSGLPRYGADVSIARGKVAMIGKIRDSAKEVLDAEGHVVAPGFIDAHTHMDAQVFSDPLGTCSC